VLCANELRLRFEESRHSAKLKRTMKPAGVSAGRNEENGQLRIRRKFKERCDI
jgi:hypothetical protein